jgi:hypothetical protein
MSSPVPCAPLTLLLPDTFADSETALKSILESGNDISLSQSGSGSGYTMEVVYCGVTFQLTISSSLPDMSGLKRIFCNLDPSSVVSVIAIGLGDHVAGGERVPAIIQALLGVAQKLGSLLGATGAIWHPANIMSGFSYFSEVVGGYLGGGAFPVLALVNFQDTGDGTIMSSGLALLSGQELRVYRGDMEQREIMRRVVRVVHDIATNGPVHGAAKLAGIEPGEIVELEPLPENGLLKMNAYSRPTA